MNYPLNCGYLSDPSQEIKATKEQNSKKSSKRPKSFHLIQLRKWKGVLWNGEQVKFSNTPDPVRECKLIHHSVRFIYSIMTGKNPCRLSIKQIQEYTGIRKQDVIKALEELRARSLITLVQKGLGPVADYYEIQMDASKWDLTSQTKDLIYVESKPMDPSVIRKRPKKAVPTVDRKDFSGSDGGPQTSFSGSDGGPQTPLVVPTVDRKEVTNLEINRKDYSFQINLSPDSKGEGDGSAPLDGPSTQEREELLPIGIGPGGSALFFNASKAKRMAKESIKRSNPIGNTLEEIYLSFA